MTPAHHWVSSAPWSESPPPFSLYSAAACSTPVPAPNPTPGRGGRGPAGNDHSPDQGLLKKWPDGGPERVWLFENAGNGYSGFSVRDERVYTMGTRDDEVFAFCLSFKTGKELWAEKLGSPLRNGWGHGPRSTPTLDDDRLYMVTGRGDVICLRQKDGKKLWSRNLKEFGGKVPTWGYSESLIVDDGRVICTPGGQDGALVALNKKNGKKLWQCAKLTGKAEYSSVVMADINGQHQYVRLLQKVIGGVDAKSGKLLWSAEWPGKTAVCPTPIVKGNQVYVTSGYGVGCMMLEITDRGAKTLWQNKVMRNHHGGVVLVGDHLYGHADYAWVCQSWQDGTEVWRDPRPAQRGRALRRRHALPGRRTLRYRVLDRGHAGRLQRGVALQALATERDPFTARQNLGAPSRRRRPHVAAGSGVYLLLRRQGRRRKRRQEGQRQVAVTGTDQPATAGNRTSSCSGRWSRLSSLIMLTPKRCVAVSISTLLLSAPSVAQSRPTTQPARVPVDASILNAKFAPTAAEIMADVQYFASDALGGRPSGSKQARLAATRIAAAFSELGLTPAGDEKSFEQTFDRMRRVAVARGGRGDFGGASDKVEFAIKKLECRNVLAWLPGSDPELREQYILIGAHFDHLGTRGKKVFNGADDNASGVAGMLAIARALAKGEIQPRRSVLFAAFGAEEQGLRGARYLASHPPRSLRKLVTMINLDMIGRPRLLDKKAFNWAKGLAGIPNTPAVGVLGTDQSPELDSLARSVFRAAKFPLFAPRDFGMLGKTIKENGRGPIRPRAVPTTRDPVPVLLDGRERRLPSTDRHDRQG